MTKRVVWSAAEVQRGVFLNNEKCAGGWSHNKKLVSESHVHRKEHHGYSFFIASISPAQVEKVRWWSDNEMLVSKPSRWCSLIQHRIIWISLFDRCPVQWSSCVNSSTWVHHTEHQGYTVFLASWSPVGLNTMWNRMDGWQWKRGDENSWKKDFA